MPEVIFVRLCTLAVRGAVSIAIGAAIWSAHLRPAVAANGKRLCTGWRCEVHLRRTQRRGLRTCAWHALGDRQ